MIQAFTEFTKDLKKCRIKPGFHFMNIEAYKALRMKMTSMKIKYQLTPPINNRANNAEREIQTLNKKSIVGMCSLDKYFHLQLWDRFLQHAIISQNISQTIKNSSPPISLY